MPSNQYSRPTGENGPHLEFKRSSSSSQETPIVLKLKETSPEGTQVLKSQGDDRVEKEEKFQEKAPSIRVLDWEHLEKWKSNTKCTEPYASSSINNSSLKAGKPIALMHLPLSVIPRLMRPSWISGGLSGVHCSFYYRLRELMLEGGRGKTIMQLECLLTVFWLRWDLHSIWIRSWRKITMMKSGCIWKDKVELALSLNPLDVPSKPINPSPLVIREPSHHSGSFFLPERESWHVRRVNFVGARRRSKRSRRESSRWCGLGFENDPPSGTNLLDQEAVRRITPSSFVAVSSNRDM